METKKWDIFEELKTEEDIQAFIEASIEEAENDTDPRLLAHAIGVAAQARRLLAAPRDTTWRGPYPSFAEDPPIGAFDKTARSMGYHITLAPLKKNAALNQGR